MTPGRKQAIESVLEVLREDIQADVKSRDGMPLTGQNVAQALGEICAQVDALAHICQALLEDVVLDEGPVIVNHPSDQDERRAAEMHS